MFELGYVLNFVRINVLLVPLLIFVKIDVTQGVKMFLTLPALSTDPKL